MFRKLTGAVACVIFASAILTGTASADAPITFEEVVVFEDVNPCSGEVQEITIIFSVRIHEHRNNFVGTAQRSGTTSDGWVMVSGNDSFVENRGGARGHFNDIWLSPDGAKFQANGMFNFNANKNEATVERLTLRCIRA